METQGIHKHQILVVDDEPTVARAMKMLLEHDGHTVHTADSGEAALVMLELDKFDVVITDYSMHGMKGVQLAARIKAHQPDLPVIMATAFAEDFNLFGKPAGDVDFVIAKPFSLMELREAVARACPAKIQSKTAAFVRC
jgi:CheY-like chemotaxis protein